MYYVWILAAAGVIAAAMLLRRMFGSSRRQVNRMFQSSLNPTGKPQGTALNTPGAAHEGLLKLAESAPEPAMNGTSNIGGHSAFNSSGVSSDISSSESSNQWTGTPTIPISSANRISTWNDRRLFQDFRGILDESRPSVALPAPEELPIRDDDYVFGGATPAIAQLLPETEARRDQQRKALMAAGYYSRASWLNLSAIRFVLAFTSLVIVAFWLLMAPPELESWLLGMLILAPPFMWALPPLLVSMRASERKIDIERGLPDVLDMMNMGVSQGLTVPQSLRRISGEIQSSHRALSEELRIVTRQAEVGSLPQALRNFSQRIESPEVNSFTSLLIQSEATGTSISRALTEYSDSMRASLKERADARANAASFKLLFPVALFLMPSVFLFLLGPAIVQVSDFVNNQGQELQRNREDALRSLNQQPELNLQRFQAGQFSNSQI